MAATPARTLDVHRLGAVDYDETHELQKRLVEARVAGEIGDTLLLLTHSPTVTLGRAAKEENVLHSKQALEALGVSLHEVGRGGDVTYHGPGQLVGYPILSLAPDRKDVRKYVSSLEETMIRVAADYDVEAHRTEGMNGTWVGMEKLGAVGVRISRWVTMHGFGLNVNTDLDYFKLIVPCGLAGRSVTSLASLTGGKLDLREVEERAASHFAAQYDAELRWHEGPPAL